MRELWNIIGAFARFLIAIPAGVLPRRHWPRLNMFVPVSRAALASSLATIALAAVMAIPAFLERAEANASVAVELMLRATGWRETPPGEHVPSVGVATGAWTATYLWPLMFLLSPRGLFSVYLLVTGYFRAISVYVDDARGDPILTAIDGLYHRISEDARTRRARREREALEGPEVPDRLVTGRSAGFPDADYVVVASRRKEEWRAGAFIITSDKWYRLGTPVEREMPGGLRTLYPLTELDDHEVLRRGIRYELPALTGSLPQPDS